jgi:hypothetical protein
LTFFLWSHSDIVCINKLTLILKMISQCSINLIKTRTVSDLTEWYPPACNTMMFKLWNTGILASYLWKKNGYGVMSRRQHPIFKIILTKNIHLGVATRSSTKLDCLKPIRFHQYTWGLQHFLTFLQEDIGHIKCYWFKINYSILSSFYIANIQMWKGQLKSYFIKE